VLDADTVTEEDVATEFFVTEEDIGKNVYSFHGDLTDVRIAS